MGDMGLLGAQFVALARVTICGCWPTIGIISLTRLFCSSFPLTAYMTMDMLNLQVLQRSDVEQERMYAAKIAPIRKHEHWLLITLLLANVIVNESLPILLDDILGGGFLAIFISTALVVCFGEIIPNGERCRIVSP